MPAFTPGPDVGESGRLQPPYLTVDEVAAMLKLSPKSVLRYARADASMPVLRIGGSVRFHRERLERWLRDREQGAPRMRRQVLSMAKPLTTKAPKEG